MKITGNKSLSAVLKLILQIALFVGTFVLIIMPFALHFFGLNLNSSMFIIYPNGLVLLIIIYKFIKLFDSLKKNEPFCDRNVNLLKSTGIVALVGSVLWILDLFYEILLAKVYDALTFVILLFLAILFFGVAIALYILSELFKEATEYKKENELTI